MEECIPKNILEAIKAREAVVFCGAGISKNSGLPLTKSMVEYILDKLSVSEKETIMKAELPFEAFIEILHESSNINRILDIFNAGYPNTNHILLAKLVKAGYVKTICTTNFDQLIEKALKKEGLTSGKDYNVFCKDEEFNSIDWNHDKLYLFKLHGSIEDKDGMAITLQQVATKTLSGQRQSIINHVFSIGPHKDVLILGYSCSDVFDISPLIMSIGKNHKRVLLIDHLPTPENKDKRVGEIEDIRTKVKKNPFRNFKESKRIFHDTDSLVAEIWKRCLDDEYFFVEPSDDSLSWKKCVDDWYLEATENYSSAIKYSIAGQIFLQISQFENAKQYFQQSLSIQREIGNTLGNKRGEGACLGHMGLVHDELGNYQGAIDYHEQALRIARETGDEKTEGNHLGNLGVTHFNLGEYRKAKKYCEKALVIARKMGDRRVEGNRLNTLGSIYRNLRKYRKAIKKYEEALKIAQDIGDKQGEGSRLHNLGIVYANRGKHQEAISNFKASLQISKEIGNKKVQGECLGCLGTAYGQLGEHKKAKKYLRQALAVNCKIGNKKAVAHDLSNLGNVYDELGEFKKAIEYYEKGIVIAKEIGNKKIEGAILRNLTLTRLRIGKIESENKKIPMLAHLNSGNIFYDRKEFEVAIQHYKKAAEINPSHDWPYYNLANAYREIGKFEQAVNEYKKAIEINPHDAGCHRNLGLVYRTIGELGLAAQEIQKCVEISHGADPLDYYNLGCLHYKMQNDREAIDWFERYIHEAPIRQRKYKINAKRIIEKIRNMEI